MAKIYRDIDDPIELEVLKENAQLGNVPNVTTNNQTPTWSMATTLANIVSGETLTKIMGKISKAINDIISHIGNKSNPHGVTKSQVGLGNVENKSSKDILNKLEVGGRNLALQSKDFTEGQNYWKINSLFTKSIDDDGFAIMSATRSNASTRKWNRIIPHKFIPVEDMHKGIVVSFDFKCDAVQDLDNGQICSLQTYNSDGVRIGWYESVNVLTLANIKLSVPLEDGIWTRAVVAFNEAQLRTVNASGHTKDELDYTSVSFNLVKNGSIHFRKIKIEYGNKATDWTPAPEDYEHILTLNKNGSKIGSYSPLSDSTINITVPTKTSELTNDSGYKTTDNNTTYTLTKSGSTISLTGSDGSKTSVTDSNTTYTLSSFGVTATAAELNKLDGCTATVTELNYVDGVTSNIQTQLNNKLSTTGTAAKATADASGQNIADTYIKGLSVNGRTITYTKGDGGTGTITTQDTNTTYSQATSSALGLVKSGGDVTVGTDGLMTVKDDSHNHTIANIDSLQTTLNSKLSTSGGTMTNTINSSKVTNTYISGNNGHSLINSTASAGSYVMLSKLNSTNGYFTDGVYQGKRLFQYTSKTTVDAGTNAVTKSLTLLDESGNSSFPGTLTATAFNGKATSATKLTTARKIAGVSFDGTKDISISYNNLTDKPTIPSGVQVIDNLTSSSTTASLSANQGRILKGYLDKKVVVSSTQPSGQQTGDTWYQII